MNRDSIIRKARACLRLSESANEHEAARALAQAEALIRRHRLRDEELAAAEAREARASARTAHAPPRWQLILVGTVGKAFGCERLIDRDTIPVEVVFVGVGPAPEVAAYAYGVLYRQCAAARQRYYRSRRGKRGNRIRRADIFAEAWVVAVAKRVEAFAEECPACRQAARSYVALRYPGLVPSRANAREIKGERDLLAAAEGWAAADGVTLHHGMGQHAAPALRGEA